MGFTPPTQPSHSDEKFKPFGVGHFYSSVGKSKALREDHNEMGLTLTPPFPLRWEIQTIRSRTPLLCCREIPTAWSLRPHLLFTPLIGILSLGVEDPTFTRSVDGKSKPLGVAALTRGVATCSRLLK